MQRGELDHAELRSAANGLSAHHHSGQQASARFDGRRHFEFIRSDVLPYTKKSTPEGFFMGAEPDWYDIHRGT